jgi:hypothetical protein
VDQSWKKRFENLRLLGWVALAAVPFGVVALLTSEFVRTFSCVEAVLLFLPAFVYAYVLIILHWKGRYRGNHSDLWGVLILIETSGWMKIVYFFRHLIPDMYASGRYRGETPTLD